MKILVCDDSDINRQILGKYLQQMGHEIIYAKNGQEAVEMFGEHAPDLVLMDIEMPVMDGYEATRTIRMSRFNFSEQTPIIFVSNYIDDESIIKGVEVGGNDYIRKPVTVGMLREKINAMSLLSVRNK